MKRVLLVTAKWPLPSSSTDGGDSTVSEVISMLGRDCKLDMLCFRDRENCAGITGVNQFYFYEEDFAQYYNYSKMDGSKFFVRLKQADAAARYVVGIADGYDLIIIHHCMFLLGLLNYSKDIFAKIILFPMFTGDSYIKSGEYVPQEYIEAEKQAIFRVSRIISPSRTEKEVLADFYGADPARVFVIPRPVKNKRFRGYAAASETVRILYIASVRRQKAHLEAVKLIEMLGRKGVTARLNCVGSVQDASIYKECMDYAERAGIRDRIAFSGTLGQEELECAMSQSDFNISVSNWETFGRGIYEGMAFGLPTLVLARIACAGEDVIPGVKPIIAENIREMAGHIASLAADPAAYERESRRGRVLAEALSVEAVGRIMKACILDETM